MQSKISESVFSKIRNIFSSFMNNGIDDKTPAHLVDRIVFCNWLCLIGTAVNFFGGHANYKNQYGILFSLNCFYQMVIVSCWFLTKNKYYLLTRIAFLTAFYVGIIFSCGIQGPVAQMEFFLLSLAAIPLSLFHPSEKRWSFLFLAVSLLGFLFFVNQSGPILDIDPSKTLYTIQDLRTNQIAYSFLLIFTLIGLSNAYARATKLVDIQRTKMFQQARLSNVGLVAANVAHELNSPLTALTLVTEMLQEKIKKNDASTDYIQETQRILRLSDRLSTIIKNFNVLACAKESGQMKHVQISKLFELSVNLSAERQRLNQIKMQLQLQNEDAQIFCNYTTLSQALFNLVDNSMDAIDSHHGDRWIRIQSWNHNKKHFIQISDSGTAPTKKISQKIFDPFFTTKPMGTGVGLGLSMAKQTFQDHGGRIQFQNNMENTTFLIELPAIDLA